MGGGGYGFCGDVEQNNERLQNDLKIEMVEIMKSRICMMQKRKWYGAPAGYEQLQENVDRNWVNYWYCRIKRYVWVLKD